MSQVLPRCLIDVRRAPMLRGRALIRAVVLSPAKSVPEREGIASACAVLAQGKKFCAGGNSYGNTLVLNVAFGEETVYLATCLSDLDWHSVQE